MMSNLQSNTSPEIWLAPMSGATDAPFRRQAVSFGVANVVSEMTACEQLIAERPDVVRRTCRHEGNSPWIVQLAGRAPEHMHAGAQLLARSGVDAIDINMGCPSRKVTGGLSGSALMREPALADEIIAATIEGASGVPVTLKMRLGWDDTMLNAPELAQRAEAAGIVKLTIHGRTRCQFYKGKADWVRIADTVSAVDIPVIANGDIECTEHARSALAASGADGVMVGRAAIGKPWLPAQISAELRGERYAEPDLQTRYESLRDQIIDAVSLYGSRQGVRVCRKHVSASISAAPIDIDAEARRAAQGTLCRIEAPDALVAALKSLYMNPHARRAA